MPTREVHLAVAVVYLLNLSAQWTSTICPLCWCVVTDHAAVCPHVFAMQILHEAGIAS